MEEYHFLVHFPFSVIHFLSPIIFARHPNFGYRPFLCFLRFFLSFFFAREFLRGAFAIVLLQILSLLLSVLSLLLLLYIFFRVVFSRSLRQIEFPSCLSVISLTDFVF